VLNSINDEVSGRVVSNAPSRLCLITDDSPTVRRIARKLLTRMGFEIDEAENGQVALDKCRDQMPDVVLLDWNMPVMNGLEFLVSLRRIDGGKAPNVILCTTETDVEHVRLAIDAGADEYLMKPFDTESLGAVFTGITYR
jgi:two-component system chemotaxis response regulator CheY